MPIVLPQGSLSGPSSLVLVEQATDALPHRPLPLDPPESEYRDGVGGDDPIPSPFPISVGLTSREPPHRGVAATRTYILPASCLLSQPALGRSNAHIALPLLLLANTLLFVPYVSGAIMYGTITLAGERMPLPNFFYMSLLGSVADFWQAKAYLIGAVVGACSASWPYLRMLIMAAALVAPPSLLPAHQCERLLRLVNATGKLAMIDFMMLTLLMVAFRLDVALPPPHNTTGRSGADVFMEVDIRVRAVPLYLILPLSIAISILTSHWMLALQRASTVDGTGSGSRTHKLASEMGVHDTSTAVDPRDGCHTPRRCAVRSHRFASQGWCWSSSHDGGRLPPLLRDGAPLLLVVCSIALLVSVTMLPAFTLRFDGLVGAALANPSTTYRLLDIGILLPGAAGPDASRATTYALTLILFVFVMGVPFLWTGCLLTLWLCPLAARSQRRLLCATERLFAWSLIDVFILTIVCGLSQLPLYATFMLGDECKAIDPLLAYFAPIIPGRPTCIDLRPSLEPGCFVILVSVVVSTGLGLHMLHMCGSAVAERAASIQQ